jgi:hypothetical protein
VLVAHDNVLLNLNFEYATINMVKNKAGSNLNSFIQNLINTIPTSSQLTVNSSATYALAL